MRQGERKGVDKGGRERSLVRVFDREDDLLAGSLPAARVYLDVPVDPSAWVTGYTLFRQGPGQFVILQLDCSPAVFPRIRSLYELMAATVEFRDPDELGADRAAALLAGEALASKFEANDPTNIYAFRSHNRFRYLDEGRELRDASPEVRLPRGLKDYPRSLPERS